MEDSVRRRRRRRLYCCVERLGVDGGGAREGTEAEEGSTEVLSCGGQFLGMFCFVGSVGRL